MNKLYNLNNLYVALISYKTNSDVGNIVKYSYTILYKDNDTYYDIYTHINDFNIVHINKIKDNDRSITSDLAMKIAKINGSYAKLNNSDYNLDNLYVGEITDYNIKKLSFNGYTGELHYFDSIINKNNNNYFDIKNNRIIDGITLQNDFNGNHIYDLLENNLVKIDNNNSNRVVSVKEAYKLAYLKKLIRK